MGTELPRNSEGNTCNVCWGPGKPFGDGPTPHSVDIQLSGLRPAKFWDDSFDVILLYPHTLLQTVNPCLFTVTDGEWLWVIEWSVALTRVQVENTTLNSNAFFHADLPICNKDVENQITQPLFAVAIGGDALISWSTEFD